MSEREDPERIWIEHDGWEDHDSWTVYTEPAANDDGGTEYVRADLATPQHKFRLLLGQLVNPTVNDGQTDSSAQQEPEGDGWEITNADLDARVGNRFIEDFGERDQVARQVAERLRDRLRARVQPRRVSREEFESAVEEAAISVMQTRGKPGVPDRILARSALYSGLRILGIEITPEEGFERAVGEHGSALRKVNREEWEAEMRGRFPITPEEEDHG